MNPLENRRARRGEALDFRAQARFTCRRGELKEDAPGISGTANGPEGIPPFFDGVEATGPPLAEQWREDRRIAADPRNDLRTRLEAFESIFESEIGDTSLTRARNSERELGLRQIHLKFEGGNATGTQKDRIAFSQAMDALRRGFDSITTASCGNYGVAMALAASCAGLRCVIHVPHGYRSRRLAEIEQLGAEIVRTEGDYESAVELSHERALTEEIYDANPGGANTHLQLKAYGEIAYEIYDELRDAPAAVAVPVSNGTTLAGVYQGFVSLHRRGKTSRIPHMIAGSAYRKNPIVHSFLKNLPRCQDLAPERIRESSVNEPLINWHASDGQPALDAIRASGGWGAHASDKAMKAYARVVREKEGLNALPASMAGFIALIEGHRQTPLPADRYVVLITGRR